MSTWTEERIDALEGRTFVVTGGLTGVGLTTVNHLLEHGAFVITGGPMVKKAEEKGRRLLLPLDLGSQRSIFSFVDRIARNHPRVDVLINAASLTGTPRRQVSRDGHELIFSVNYLGHFILTSQLLPLLLRGSDPRVVTVSSLRHRSGQINLSDLDLTQGFTSDKAYAQGRLAQLMFSLELHRRTHARAIPVKSIPVHSGAGELLPQRGLGALPILFAATSLEARSGVYYGPGGPLEFFGNPSEAKVAVSAENRIVAEKLWEESEKLTGVRFDVENLRSIGLH